MAKEDLKPMPELKGVIYPPKPEEAEGAPLSKLQAISARYDRTIKKVSTTEERLGIDSFSGQQLVPERTAKKEIREAIQGIKIPENLSGKAMLDAALQIGAKREQAKDQAIRNKTVDTKKRLQTKSIPELQQKKATFDYLIKIEEEYERIQSFNSSIYTEEELKELKETRDAEILPLVTFVAKVPEEKAEQSAEPEGSKPAEEIVPAPSPEQPAQEEAEIEMPNFTNISTLEEIAVEALKTGLREKRTVSGSELIEKIWGEIDKKTGKGRLNTFMTRLRSKIAKQQTEWDILNTTFEQRRSRVEGQYKLEKKGKTDADEDREKPRPSVPSTKEQTVKVKKPKGTRKTETKNTQERKNKFPEVTESRRKALEAIIENPDLTLQEVKDILGHSKRGKPLTWMQALYALTRASNILYVRIDKKIEKFYEFSLWNRIRSYANNGTPICKEVKKAILNSFKEKLKAWFEIKKSEAQKEEIIKEQPVEEIEEITPFSDHETMILTGLTGIMELDLDNVTSQTCKNFVYGMRVLEPNFAEKLTLEEYKDLRSAVLKKIGLLNGDRRDKIVDSQYTDAETILTGLCCGNEDKIPQITEYLSPAQDSDILEEMNKIVALWEKWEDEVSKSNTQEKIEEKEEIVLPEGEETVISPPSSNGHEIGQFEKENPDIRQVVSDFFRQINGKESMFPLTGRQLERIAYPQVTERTIIECGQYVYPEPGTARNYHERYSLEESAVLFCLRKRTNLTQAKVKELRKIIAEQYVLWKKEKEESNGKSVKGNGNNGRGK